MKVLIVIPAYNEGRRIGGLLQKLSAYRNDILVVDDGSSDDTAFLVNQLGFRCFSHEVNLGLSGIYRQATRFAKEQGYTHILSLDGDGQHDPDYIPRFFKALHQYNFVSGRRFNEPEAVPPVKIASNLFAIMLIGEVIHSYLPDVSCGYRGWRTDIFPDDESIFTGLYEKCRYGIIYKMLIESVLNGHKIGFVPMPAIYPADARLNTKTVEIVGLLKTVLSYKSIPSVEIVSGKILSGQEAEYESGGIHFTIKPDSGEAFLFKTDNARAIGFFRGINASHAVKA